MPRKRNLGWLWNCLCNWNMSGIYVYVCVSYTYCAFVSFKIKLGRFFWKWQFLYSHATKKICSHLLYKFWSRALSPGWFRKQHHKSQRVTGIPRTTPLLQWSNICRQNPDLQEVDGTPFTKQTTSFIIFTNTVMTG